MQNMEFLYLVPLTYRQFRPMETRVPPPPNVTSPILANHRHPSRGPVRASMLLSVSEANVCSVDMDEMSLIDDDWEGLVLLFTAASVLRADLLPHHSCFFLPNPLLLCILILSILQWRVLFLPVVHHRFEEEVLPLQLDHTRP